MRSRISIRGSVRPLVRQSVGPSVLRSCFRYNRRSMEISASREEYCVWVSERASDEDASLNPRVLFHILFHTTKSIHCFASFLCPLRLSTISKNMNWGFGVRDNDARHISWGNEKKISTQRPLPCLILTSLSDPSLWEIDFSSLKGNMICVLRGTAMRPRQVVGQ